MPTKLNPDMGTIGDVKYSILVPDEFKKLNGDGWRLMDGTPIGGTELAKYTVLTHLPDASNNFIRCLDPKDKSRVVGSPQNDTTRLPRTKKFTGGTSTTGEHAHSLAPYRPTFVHGHQHKTGAELSGVGKTPPIYTQTDGEHNHNIIVNGGGDPETRPKNIALYIYIKVN